MNTEKGEFLVFYTRKNKSITQYHNILLEIYFLLVKLNKLTTTIISTFQPLTHWGTRKLQPEYALHTISK